MAVSNSDLPPSRAGLPVRRARWVALAALAALASGIAVAHHASTPHYDESKTITVVGVVTEFKLVNPHAQLYFDVTDSNGKVANWNCELNNVGILQRNGWTQKTFARGDRITVNGFPAWRDPHGCSLAYVILPDGTRLNRPGAVRGVAVLRGESPATSTRFNARSFAGSWSGAGGPPKEAVDFSSILTDAGKAALAKYDSRYDDPGFRCSPSSIIRAWGEPFSVTEITQTPETITIRHEFMDTVRVVDMRTRKHPPTTRRSLTGHSVGWFEGDTLVIETVGLQAGVLMPNPGLMNSDAMTVVERLSLSADGQQLSRSYEVTDPKFFKLPLTDKNFPCLWTCRWTRTTAPRTKYDCKILDNVSHVRPASTRKP